MEKRMMIAGFFVLLILMSGCKTGVTETGTTGTTGTVTKEICDDTCQGERDAYAKSVNDLLTQAQAIIAEIPEWRSVTKKDLADMTTLKDKVSALKVPEGFETAHDYYQRAFNDYVEAVASVVKANEGYSKISGISDVQSRNAALTKVLDDVQNASKILVYADEEVKFAARLSS